MGRTSAVTNWNNRCSCCCQVDCSQFRPGRVFVLVSLGSVLSRMRRNKSFACAYGRRYSPFNMVSSVDNVWHFVLCNLYGYTYFGEITCAFCKGDAISGMVFVWCVNLAYCQLCDKKCFKFWIWYNHVILMYLLKYIEGFIKYNLDERAYMRYYTL